MTGKVFAGALAVLVVFGCSDPPTTSTTLNDDAVAPSFNFFDGPDNPGNSGVFRFQNVEFVATTDLNRDYYAIHFQADDWSVCGGASDPLASDVQWVTNMEDVVRAITQLVDAPLFIYRLSDLFDPDLDLCSWLEEDWLYQGTHTVKSHDNDFFNSGPGANSWGWSGQGRVYDQAGTKCQYHEHQNAVVSPDDQILSWKNEDIWVNCAGGPN